VTNLERVQAAMCHAVAISCVLEPHASHDFLHPLMDQLAALEISLKSETAQPESET
jgi:hypothetical protein